MNKKKTLIITSIAFIIITATLLVSYGYITASVSGNESSKKSAFNSQIIKVEYSDGTENLTSKQGVFTPGSTITKTFTIKNIGNVSVKYSINLDNITNTFTRKNDITYELTSNDNILKNGMYDAKGIFPDNKLMILNKDILNVGESKTYTLKINYLNSEENQIVDSGKSLKARIVLEESKININKLIVYGNSVQNGTPTPETPVEIESVGEKTENLFDPNVTTDKIRGSYLGFELTDWEGTYGMKVTLKPGKEVPTGIAFGFVYGDSSGVTNAAWILESNKGLVRDFISFTPSNSNGTAGIAVYPATKATFDKVLDAFDIMLVKGSYSSYSIPSYEPYNKYKIPINIHGKNLFNDEDLLEMSSVISKGENGYIASQYPIHYPSNSKLVNHLKKVLKPNVTYTLSRKVSNYSSGSTGAIWIRDKSANILTVAYGNGIKSVTFSLTQEQIDSISNVYVYGHPSSPTTFEYIQLEEGDTATTYEHYNSNELNIILEEPLRKIGKYADYIDFENNKVVRNVTEIDIQTLGVNDFWFDAAATKEESLTASVYRLNTSKPKIANAILSNYFAPVNVYSNEEGVRNIGTSSFIGFNVLKSRLTNWDESLTDNEKESLVRDYLSTLTDLKVYYPISTDDTETIELPNILLNKETNIIEACSNNGVCGEIEVEYDE